MHAQVFECYQYTCHIHMCMCMCMCICIRVYRKHGWMRIWTPQATHRILSVHQSYSYVHIHVYGKHAQMRIWTADTPLVCLLSQCISIKTWLNISGLLNYSKPFQGMWNTKQTSGIHTKQHQQWYPLMCTIFYNQDLLKLHKSARNRCIKFKCCLGHTDNALVRSISTIKQSLLKCELAKNNEWTSHWLWGLNKRNSPWLHFQESNLWQMNCEFDKYNVEI